MKFQNKVALVTGSSRGIGRAIALAFAGEGADIALNCSKSLEAAEEVAREIRTLGKRAAVFQADVADKTSVDSMIESVINEFG